MGGLVPETYFLCQNQVKSEELLDYKTLVLPPRSKELLEFKVELSGSILRYCPSSLKEIYNGDRWFPDRSIKTKSCLISWSFYSKNGDIGFAVYSKKLISSTAGNHDLVPYSRVDCHLTHENGEIYCNEPGTCNLLISNEFQFTLYDSF